MRDPTLPYVIPEPSTAVLLGLGLIGLAASARRAARQRTPHSMA